MYADPTPLDLGGLLEFTSDDSFPSTDTRQLRLDFTRFMMRYKFGMEEVVTKISILRDEFAHLHDDNPIENISSRLKRPDSIIEKMQRKGTRPTFASIQETITDIAGVRVTCSFVSDVRRVFDLVAAQSDIAVIAVRDYIAEPKPNGYRSLHALVEVPVFLTDGPVPVVVEVQFRTIAMDFWASLEHKIYYKYRADVPEELLDGLREAADTASSLDSTMERLRSEVKTLGGLPPDSPKEESGMGQELVPDDSLITRLRHLADD
ncbi:GTP pyrophosphokinase [Aeromicrobium sp.]